MNRRIMLAALGLAAASTMVTSALAKETKPMGLSIRACRFFPSSDASRNENRTWLGFGAEFKIQDLNYGMGSPGMSSHFCVSVDYMGSGDFLILPVLLNWVGRTNEFYYT